MDEARQLIEHHAAAIARLCDAAHVRRLALFGSGTRPDFDAARSDLDFLVEFEALPPKDYAEAYFTLREGLQSLLAKPVDLLTDASLANPYLRARVLEEARAVYAK
ncbi:nucleotidyltransferase family protein [Ramlibacter sp.]|uniref:nucleotidyltransferase family protein n=1 Tax=Ramlibacter sp. TaxID=1917967 RepID=UPI0035B0E542